MPPSHTPLIPAKAGTQIHPEKIAPVTWAPAFAGVSGSWLERQMSN